MIWLEGTLSECCHYLSSLLVLWWLMWVGYRTCWDGGKALTLGYILWLSSLFCFSWAFHLLLDGVQLWF
jgi:hypothetical protein